MPDEGERISITQLVGTDGYGFSKVQREAGLSPSGLSRTLKGETKPTLETARKIARVFDLEPDDIEWPRGYTDPGERAPRSSGSRLERLAEEDLLRVAGSDAFEVELGVRLRPEVSREIRVRALEALARDLGREEVEAALRRVFGP